MSNFSGNELNNKIILPLIKKYKKKREELKKAIKDPNLGLKEKLELIGKLHRLPKHSSPVRYRSVDKKTGLNYFQIRLLASAGKLPGYRRASW